MKRFVSATQSANRTGAAMNRTTFKGAGHNKPNLTGARTLTTPFLKLITGTSVARSDGKK
jgi:hypothetical protein